MLNRARPLLPPGTITLLLAGALGLGGCTAQDRTSPLTPPSSLSQLVVSPSSVNFQYTPGGVKPAPVAINVAGSAGTVTGITIGTVLYSPISSGWLTAKFQGAPNFTPTTITLVADPPVDLLPGTYVATIPIGSTVSGVADQSVVATLTIDPTPVISLSPRTVQISAAQGGANPQTQFVHVDNAGSGTLSGLSVGAIAYGAGASGWLTASLAATTAPVDVALDVNLSGLALGTYTARVPVLSSLTGVTSDTISVTLGVGAPPNPPSIALSPTALTVSATAGGSNPTAQQVGVSNGGGGSLTGLFVGPITYGAGANGWLGATLNTFTAPATLSLQPTITGLAVGTYTATVQVGSSLAGVANKSTTLTLVIGAAPVPPAINLAPSNVTLSVIQGAPSPAPVSVSVGNSGGGNLNLLSLGGISYGPGATGWLSAGLSNTSAPATVTLTPNTAGLAVGTFTATVPVQSGVVGVATKNITVTATVAGTPIPPAIGAAPDSVTFTATAGGSGPAAKNITITNAGGGTLTGLALGTVSYGTGATGWLAGSLSGGTAPATATLTPTITGIPAGTYRATIPLSATGASNTPKTLIAILKLTGPIGLVLSPSTVNFTGTTGQPSPGSVPVNVTNSGGGVLTGLAAGGVTYGAGQPTGWLSTSLSGTTTPAVLVLSATTGALAAGTYTATVPVSSTTPGVTSKTATVTFSVGTPGGSFVILAGNNQSGYVGTTLPVKLKARVYDGAGNPAVGVAVNWQVNNGGTLLNTISTSNSLGEVETDWKVGPLAGLHTVTVSSAGLPTLTFTADVILPPNPGAHPNEPAGYVAFAEHNMSDIPSAQRSPLGALLGAWYGPGLTDPDLAVVTPDLTAPESPPNVMQIRFAKGFAAGRGPVNFGGWDVAGKVPAGQKSKVYFTMWVKCVGPDYENQAVGTKFGFFGASDPTSAAAHNSWFFIKGTGTQSIASTFKVQLHQSLQTNPPTVLNLDQNVDTRALMSCNVWHQWEAILELNTLGQADGIFKWWIDGILIMDRRNMTYIIPGLTTHFYDYVFNPTWGGTTGVKTRDDFFRIDHIYMSGVP